MDAKRPWTPSLDPPRLHLEDLPEEVISEIVPHMTYATLICCAAVNKAFRSYGWSTWRKQVLLMRTSWGTAENYRRVFERHVLPKLERYFDYYDTPGDGDCIEICTNLIHNFLLPRRVDAAVKADSLPSGALPGSSSDSLPLGPPKVVFVGQGHYEHDNSPAQRERARVVLRNAEYAYKWLVRGHHNQYGWWEDDGTFRNDRTRDEPLDDAEEEWDEDSRDGEHWRAEYMAVMSSCHVPVTVQILQPRCGINFKLAIARMQRGHCLQWSGKIAEMYPNSHFINGTYQRHDKRSEVAEGEDASYLMLQWQQDKIHKQEAKEQAEREARKKARKEARKKAKEEGRAATSDSGACDV